MFAALTLPLALAVAAQAAPAPTGPCAAPERHQLDFWIGAWDVFPANAPTTLVAHSRIESLGGGCGIRETWMPLKGAGGGSISAYIPEQHKWRQAWLGANGVWADFTGGQVGDAVAIQGVWAAPGKPHQITRMTYRPLADGAVQQLGETSDDDGKTWQPSFDFRYKRAGSD